MLTELQKHGGTAVSASAVPLCVTQPGFDPVEDLTRFRSFVAEHAEDIANPQLRFAGVIVNLHKRINEHAYQLEGLKELVENDEIL